jgi:hypothetical protein
VIFPQSPKAVAGELLYRVKIRLAVPIKIKRTSGFRSTRHSLHFFSWEKREPTRLKYSIGPVATERNAPLYQKDSFIRAMPMRLEHVSSRIANQHFQSAGLGVFSQRDAFRPGWVGRVVRPLRSGQVRDHRRTRLAKSRLGERKCACKNDPSKFAIHRSSLPVIEKEILEKCDIDGFRSPLFQAPSRQGGDPIAAKKCRANSSPASKLAGASPENSRKSFTKCDWS